jgi:hypothetical protein
MAEPNKSGCSGRMFAYFLILDVVFWTVVGLIWAVIQSTGGAAILTTTPLGQVRTAVSVPFIQSLFSSGFVLGMPCLGSVFICTLLYAFVLRPRTKRVDAQASPPNIVK